MTIKDLVPWKWGEEKQVPVKRSQSKDTLTTLHNDIDRLFDNFFRGFDLAPFGESFSTFSPNIDVRENDHNYQVTAELPGMDENDIEVTLDHNSLTIRGEKKQETQDKGHNYYRMERSYGSFQRSISLPPGIDSGKIDANFNKGILTITLPKTTEAQKHAKHIPVKTR
jgi:HSP20 family protein